MRDGDFTLADSTAISPVPRQEAARVAQSSRKTSGTTPACCGSTPTLAAPSIGMPCIRCSSRPVVGPNIRNVPTDKAVVDDVDFDKRAAEKSLAISTGADHGKFLVGDAMTLADIAIVSNFIVYQYLGFEIDAGRYSKLSRDISARSRRNHAFPAGRWRTKSRLSSRWG